MQRNIVELRSRHEFRRILSTEQVVFLFKHSTRCGTSAMALSEFQRFSHHAPDSALAYIDVIASLALSNLVAEETGIQHQSPQCLLFRDGKVVWSASHRAITQSALISALER